MHRSKLFLRDVVVVLSPGEIVSSSSNVGFLMGDGGADALLFVVGAMLVTRSRLVAPATAAVAAL
jgi:hypothetical protein